MEHLFFDALSSVVSSLSHWAMMACDVEYTLTAPTLLFYTRRKRDGAVGEIGGRRGGGEREGGETDRQTDRLDRQKDRQIDRDR